MDTNIQTQDRSAIRLQNAYSYVAEYFPELPESSRLVLADCIVKALFKSTAPARLNQPID
jgi:hypothetical protein